MLFKKKENSEKTSQNKRKSSIFSKISELKVKLGGFSRLLAIFLCYFILTVIIGIMLFSRIQNIESLKVVENGIASVVSPAQNGFNKIINGIAKQLRTIKLRSNIEEEYNKLLQENEQLIYDAMLAKELQVQLSQYKSLFDEVSANSVMNPLACRVIGRDSGNYFSVFTINKGSINGIKEFMAVTFNGSLIGYTYNVSLNKCDVRTIIDSEASIAALIQSTRDQGTVRGTLGIDGRPLCRMYYLPDDNLPRPGDEVVTSGVGMPFPKGIPIGTVRESTRGIEENKQYVVIEPKTDFRHIENVIVLRYTPEALSVGNGDIQKDTISYDPIPSIVPIPNIFIGNDEYALAPTASPNPEEALEGEELENIESAEEASILENSKEGNDSNGGENIQEESTSEESLEYVVPNQSKAPDAKITIGPTPTPAPTEPPLNITIEEE